MPASVTWVGTRANQQQQSYNKLNRGIIEYVETWRGDPTDGSWPAYVVGGAISPTVAGVALGALTWYDISVESPTRGPVNAYVAKASNKFDVGKEEWTLDINLGTYSKITSIYVVSGSFYFANGVFWLSLPSVRKTSYHINPPLPGLIGQAEVPVPPFTLPTPTLPAFTNETYGWVKNLDLVQQQHQIWVRTQGWSFQLTIAP